MPAPEDQAVTPLVRKATAWAWRLLLLLTTLVAVLWVVKHLLVIFVPVALAGILTALLLPGVDWLDHHRIPRGGAVFILLLSAFAVLGGILTFVVSQFIDGLPQLVDQVSHSIDTTRDWLTQGPLHLTRQQIDQVSKSAVDTLRNNQTRITSGALSTTKTITEIITGAFVVLFTLIFFLYGGRNIYQFVTQIFPVSVREKVREAGKAGFGALIGYVRATFLVALVDATGIGTGLAIMSVPLALPLASLVFLGAFIPLVGAVISGFLAVIVALIAKGWVYALITLGVVIGVQQLEAHVLQPLVMGRAVSIHPLAVILGITAGGVLGGIVGALLAVPTIAFVDRAARVLLERPEEVGAPGERPDEEEPVAITAKRDEID
ncbi:MAG: AI-2E family transporter [Mycobacteriaceae bacterium]|nr:AI-2E family transporter [Mycobacteriaceae bacterium]